jgi:hypothetical protein
MFICVSVRVHIYVRVQNALCVFFHPKLVRIAVIKATDIFTQNIQLSENGLQRSKGIFVWDGGEIEERNLIENAGLMWCSF